MAGGELRFTMQAEPNRDWARRRAAAVFDVRALTPCAVRSGPDSGRARGSSTLPPARAHSSMVRAEDS